eukprot:36394-Heterocapsa_arctica.AAC.1
MGEHYRDEDGEHGPSHGAGRDGGDMHSLQQSRGLSEPQAGCVRIAIKMLHVQGIHGRARNGQ